MISWKIAVAAIALAVHLATIARALLIEGREPQARASWLLLLLALPGIGTVLYLLFGEPWVSSAFRARVDKMAAAVRPFAPSIEVAAARTAQFGNAIATCVGAAGWPATDGNRARVAPDSDAAIDMIVADIDAATRTIHISFYIWLNDHNGTKVGEAICRAARRGVVCRVAADAIGSRAFTRSSAWSDMREAGAHLLATLRVPLGLGFLAGHRLDLRNHRKITVIDGRITYCGSQNCADPAFLPKRHFAPWVDILIRYEGAVAQQADLIFAALWMAETGEDLRAELAIEATQSSGGVVAIAVGTGPISPRGTMTELFTACLAAARERVIITTPYFAPDPALLGAILAAARRGVALTMILPHRNDSRIVGAISRAYYPVLAKAGVRIFEFRGGLLHAKTLVVDGELALVGSSNMDRRSLDLNFENNVLFQSTELASDVMAHQQRWLADAIEIDHGGIAARSLPRRLLDNLLTIVGALF